MFDCDIQLYGIPNYFSKVKHYIFYLMHDLGGTIDVIAHEMTDDSLKEIFRATGGDWGGTKVDQLFIKYLEQLFPKKTWLILKQIIKMIGWNS